MKPQKLPYQALPDGFRAKIKTALNALLRPAGLEIATTLEKRIEAARLQKLQQREHWSQPRYLEGLTFDSKAALTFLSQTCSPYQSEYERLPQSPNGDESQFFLENGWFGSVDAEVLYGVVRRFKPVNIVEVGSGFSTRLMRRAISEGNLNTRITSIDPSEGSKVQPFVDEHIKMMVEDLDIERLTQVLSPNDILFIDSSHRVTTGGDIPFLFLEVIPRLRQGVLIHIHDIFFPFDYPAEWMLHEWGWTEQYLVHAFLSYNQAFRVLWPASYMWEYHRSEVIRAIPNPLITAQPSSLWLKKLV